MYHHLFQQRTDWESEPGLVDQSDTDRDAVPIALNKICNLIQSKMLYSNIHGDAVLGLKPFHGLMVVDQHLSSV